MNEKIGAVLRDLRGRIETVRAEFVLMCDAMAAEDSGACTRAAQAVAAALTRE